MKLIKTTLLVTSIGLVLSGCYKPGCTDPGADNYDAKANKENLTCSYNGSVVFWIKSTSSDSLIDLGHEMLRFELEGLIVDSIATSGFSSTSGGCNTSGTKTISRQFSGNTERDYKYRVKGYDFATIYEGFVEIKAGDCVSVRLD